MLYLCPGPASKGERVVLHQDEELLPERIELQLGAFWLWSWQGQGQWTRIIMVSCFDEQATVARVRWSWKPSAFGGEHSRDFSFIEVGIADYSGRSIMKVEVSRAQYLYTLPQTPTHLPREQSHRYLCASGPPLMLHPAFVAMFGTFRRFPPWPASPSFISGYLQARTMRTHVPTYTQHVGIRILRHARRRFLIHKVI